MSLGIGVNSEEKAILVVMIINSVKVSPLKMRIKDKLRIINYHSQLSTAVKLKIRVIFFEKTFQKLRFTQVKLVKRVFLSLSIKSFVNVETIGRSVPQVNDRSDI